MLRAPSTPNLPLPSAAYSVPQQSQFANVLRLYFNQLSSALQSLFGTAGGRSLQLPFGEGMVSTTLATSANTATAVSFSALDAAIGFGLSGGALQADYTGVYNVQFSVQVANSDSQAHSAWVWLQKNGVDLPATSSVFSVPAKHGTTDGHVIGAANFIVEAMAGDTLGLMWATDNALVVLEAIPAQTTPFVRPLSPSVVLTAVFVSAQE